MVILIVLIMMILIIMMIIMILLLMMMMNTEKLGVLKHYLKSLIEIITNQQEPIMVLQEEEVIT